MARNKVASPAAVTPRGGRISTARRGLQPTCTAPSGRSSTGSAGSSADSDGVGCAMEGTVPRRSAENAQLSTAPQPPSSSLASPHSLIDPGTNFGSRQDYDHDHLRSAVYLRPLVAARRATPRRSHG